MKECFIKRNWNKYIIIYFVMYHLLIVMVWMVLWEYDNETCIIEQFV